MPKHPAKLTKKFKSNPKLTYPFNMNRQQKDDYQKYIFAVTQYQDLVAYLNSTSEDVDPKTDEKKGYGRGPAGLQKDMDQEMLTLLQNCVAELIQTGQALFADLNEIKNPELQQRALLYDVTQTLSTATKENSVLETLEPEEKISYMAMHARATNIIIDIGQGNLDKVGGAISTRHQVRYVDEKGKLQEGFFTEDVDTGTSLKKFYEELVDLCPNMTAIFSDLEGGYMFGPDYDDPEFMKVAKLFPKISDDTAPDSTMTADSLKQFLRARGVSVKLLDEAALTDENAQNFQKFRSSVQNIDFGRKLRFEANSRQDSGYNVNNRNTAMSDMAAALGMKGLLAKSNPLTLIKDGKPIHGTFMAKAEGVSIDDVSPDTELMQGKELKIDYDKVVKDGTDMMVLDYICLNVDRHQNNHFYKIEKGSDGEPTLVGLQGIDNDDSFGNSVPDANEGVHWLPPLNEIIKITRQTADMVQGLTEGRIKGILLGKGLSEDEITACWNRAQKLQEHIRSGNVKIIKGNAQKSDFEKMIQQGERIGKDSATPFENISQLQKEYSENLEKFKRNNPDKKAQDKAFLKKQKEERNERIKTGLKNLKSKVYVDYRMTIKCQSKEIKSLYSKLNSPNDADSKEYKEMYAAVKELNDNLKLFQKKDAKLNDRTLKPDEKLNILSEQFKEVQSCIRTYVSSLPKEQRPADKKRVSTANALQQVCNDASTSRELEVHQLNTLMKNAFTQIKNASEDLTAVKGKKPFEEAVADRVLKAKMHMGSFIGNCQQPTKEDLPKLHKDMATLVIANKIGNLKKNNPSVYQNLEKEISKDSTKLDGYVQQILKNSDFKKIMKQTNPINALVNNTADEVTKLAEDMNVFRNIAMDTSVDPLTNGSHFR